MIFYLSPNVFRVIKSVRMIGEAVGVCGGKERCIQGYSEETSMERDQMVDMPTWNDHTKMDHNENVWNSLQYIDLATDRDKWRADRSIWLPYSARNLTSQRTVSSSTRNLLQGIS